MITTKRIVTIVVVMVLLNVTNVTVVEGYLVVLATEKEQQSVKSVEVKVKLIVEEIW